NAIDETFCQMQRCSDRQNTLGATQMSLRQQNDGTSEGVAAVDRALAILSAFTPADRTITLAELARRTGLYKSTILRLSNSLMSAGFMEKLESGHYRLGAAVFRLGTVY